MAVSSRKWTVFGSETDSVSDECNSSTAAGQFIHMSLLSVLETDQSWVSALKLTYSVVSLQF